MRKRLRERGRLCEAKPHFFFFFLAGRTSREHGRQDKRKRNTKTETGPTNQMNE